MGIFLYIVFQKRAFFISVSKELKRANTHKKYAQDVKYNAGAMLAEL